MQLKGDRLSTNKLSFKRSETYEVMLNRSSTLESQVFPDRFEPSLETNKITENK